MSGVLESTAVAVSNCVLVGNSASNSGGGVWLGTLRNCTLIGNSAAYGGGAYQSTLNDCTLIGNSAQRWGGGADSGTLNNCTLTGNFAADGGGVGVCPGWFCYPGEQSVTLNNCTLTGNFATNSGGGALGGTLNNCTLTSNSAQYGGGARRGTPKRCTLNNCTLTRNSAVEGGGASISELNNCTLTGNSSDRWGGGASGGTLNNCTLTSNWAGDEGGGAFATTLNNCALSANSATNYGGGAAGGTLNNCTLTGNSAGLWGGGVSGFETGFGRAAATLNNCIVYFNTAVQGANHFESTLNYCCTTPQPTNGVGNITNAPLFVDYAGGNLRLQFSSPCINAGLDAYAPGPTDLDSNPRIVSGTVDIGAYEFQGLGSTISYASLQEYGLPTDGSADFIDTDHDGRNNWQEWRCGTCPTNALSVLRLLAPTNNLSGVTVSWQSVSNRAYSLERATNLASSPAFVTLATGIAGQSGTTTFLDTNAPSTGPCFYRVGTQR